MVESPEEPLDLSDHNAPSISPSPWNPATSLYIHVSPEPGNNL